MNNRFPRYMAALNFSLSRNFPCCVRTQQEIRIYSLGSEPTSDGVSRAFSPAPSLQRQLCGQTCYLNNGAPPGDLKETQGKTSPLYSSLIGSDTDQPREALTPTEQNFFEEKQTVRFQHCDPAGIVFYPRYYEMLNLTVERFFEHQLGYSFNRLHKELSVTVPAVRIETDFLDASYLEDVLQFQMTLDRIGGSSLGFQIVCKCQDEERLRALVTLVCIDFEKKKATPWPAAIRGQIDEILASDKSDTTLNRPDPSIVEEY